MEEILSKLNDSQKAAVLYNDGPSLVVAGAGSGKTRVLTYKIAGLIKQGYQPSSILALTFTNKAAAEMKKRIIDIVGNDAMHLWMGTFHSIFSRILRIECRALGFSRDFTIYDTDDTKSKIRDIIKELGLNDKDYTPKKVISRISNLKNELILPSMYDKRSDLQQTDFYQHMPRLKEIYRMYMNQCHRANAMDFDDLLLYTNILFRDFPEILAKYQEMFKFVLVDEYQDTNFSQSLIIRKLVSSHHRLCVVGDDAQSIYSFRGANIQNILKFKENFPDCRLFKLEQNYRSTPNIVEVANSLIAKNEKQIQKNVFSEKQRGNKVKIYAAYSDKDESMLVGNSIKSMLSDYRCEDFAILYRTNAQSRLLEESLRSRSIPYKIHGGNSFYQRKVIRDIVAYLRLIINHNDEEAFKRAAQYPKKGIGNSTIDKIKSVATEKDMSYWDVTSDPLGNGLDLGAAAIKRLVAFREKIEEFSSIVETTDAYTITKRVYAECGILDDLSHENTDEAKDNKQLAEELLKGINEYCEEQREEAGQLLITVADYLQVIALMTDQDLEKESDQGKVTLMTVHAAKGLEFKNVFIVGLEEELFPSSMNLESNEGIEEERRLFYVAITRAEENCFITYAKSRFLNGKTSYPSPSRFLTDINPSLIDLPADFNSRNSSVDVDDYFSSYRKPYTSFNASNRPSYSSFTGSKTTVAPKPVETYERRNLKKITVAETSVEQSSCDNALVGKKVRHKTFGVGTIKSVEMIGADQKYTILFENAGERKIIAKFANLEML